MNLSSICVAAAFSAQSADLGTLRLLRPHRVGTHCLCRDNMAIIIVKSALRIFGSLISLSVSKYSKFNVKLALLSKLLDPIEKPIIISYFLNLIQFPQPSYWYNDSLYYCAISHMIFNSHTISTASHTTLIIEPFLKHSAQCLCYNSNRPKNYTLLIKIIFILGTTHNCQDAL